MSLKPRPATLRGEYVYRVIQNLDDDGYTTFKVKVKTASDRQINLERPFPFLGGTRFNPTALGSSFHATVSEAVADFARRQRGEIAHANRKIIRAAQALAWARRECPSAVDQHEEMLARRAARTAGGKVDG